MKKLFIFTMLCLFGLCSLQAQTQTGQDPVRWVKAVAEDASVDVSWSVVPSTTDYEDFETGGLATRDWNNTSEHPWVLTEKSYEGKFAMKATGERIDKAVSAIELDYETKDAGFVAFHHRVSSEAKYDKGNFYIDGELKSTISGDKEWGYIEFFIPAGKHTYRWEYAKDSLTNTGSDSYFVDNISFYKPVTPFEGGWITYDDDKYTTSIGTGKPSPVYWGISFPMTAAYKDLTLSKVAVYDTEAGGNASVTANIYLGGTDAPEELVSTQDFKFTGAGEVIEIELDTPVSLDGTRPLWITFYCEELSYPVGVCASVGDPNSDWLSLDGEEWVHAYEYGFESSCIIRGYLESFDGKIRTLSNETKPTFKGGASTGEFVAVADAEPRYLASMVRAAKSAPTYKIYKKNILTEESNLIAENVTDTVYADNAWATTAVGAYQYGVAAVYSETTATVWSNVVDKDMSTKVNVKVTTDTKEPVAGTKVSFKNLIEEEYSYSVILDIDGIWTCEDFRKGEYEVTIFKKGYDSEYETKTVEIWGETTIECELTEDLAAVKDLYVSPTGWVMWDGAYVGSGDEFLFDFEDCSLNGWVNIDADKDNYVWLNSIEIAPPGSGFNESVAFATSFSCLPNGTYDPLTPDNYLVTAERYNIGELSQLRFWVSAQDANYPYEHYGVAISLESNTTEEGFVTIWEETLSAKSGGAKGVRGTAAQGAWYEKVVDLSSYAGQSVYIAIRHFDCTDQFFIGVDDISLENNTDRSLTTYKIYLDDKLVADNVKTPFYQHENLVDGKEYTTKVIPFYTMGEGAPSTYTWKYFGCSNYEGVADFEAENRSIGNIVTWTMPETEAATAKSRAGEWLTYDDGVNVEKIGLTYDETGTVLERFKWAAMFPAKDVAKHAGKFITKLSIYDLEEFDGECFIYEGGSATPGTLLHSQSFSCKNTGDYTDIVLTKSVELSGNQNVWIVFDSGNGRQPASVCADQGNPNGRWVYYEGFGWLDLAMVSMPAFTWQIKAFVTDNTEDVVTIPDAEALGVMLYRNGELIEKLYQGQEYIDKGAEEGDTYTIRVVYGGEKDLTYYAMSCEQTVEAEFKMECTAPAELSAEPMYYDENKFGAMIGWPLPDKTIKWFQYDNGEFDDAIGGLESFYWGVMFPVGMQEGYVGANLTKISYYDHVAQEGTLYIYYGGDDAPGTLIHTQPFYTAGVEDFVDIDLTTPLPVPGENLWVVVGTISGMKWPAAMSTNVSELNGRWISLDGTNWEDAAGLGFGGSWMLRAFATTKAKGASMPEPIEFVNTATGKGTLSKDPNPVRTSTLKNYNIYRGTSLDDMEVVGTTTETTYFDEVERGTYYYRVTALYEENGETCESAFAAAYEDDKMDYVVVEVTAIDENGVKGMMVYPNPTMGDLNITAENMTRITIANSLGQVVYDRQVAGDNEIINMSQYKAGVYMVRIMTENGVAVKRISVL